MARKVNVALLRKAREDIANTDELGQGALAWGNPVTMRTEYCALGKMLCTAGVKPDSISTGDVAYSPDHTSYVRRHWSRADRPMQPYGKARIDGARLAQRLYGLSHAQVRNIARTNDCATKDERKAAVLGYLDTIIFRAEHDS